MSSSEATSSTSTAKEAQQQSKPNDDEMDTKDTQDKLSTGLRSVLQDVVTACDTQFERVAHSQAALAARLDALESKLATFQAKVGTASRSSGGGGEAGGGGGGKAEAAIDATIFQDYAKKVHAIRGRVDGVNRQVDVMRKRVRAVEDIVKTKRSLAEAVIGQAAETPEEEEQQQQQKQEQQGEAAGAKA